MRELIQTDAYGIAMRSLEASHTSAMVSSPEGPIGLERREHHHRMLAALRELASELAGRASAAAEIEMRLSAEQADDDNDEDID